MPPTGPQRLKPLSGSKYAGKEITNKQLTVKQDDPKSSESFDESTKDDQLKTATVSETTQNIPGTESKKELSTQDEPKSSDTDNETDIQDETIGGINFATGALSDDPELAEVEKYLLEMEAAVGSPEPSNDPLDHPDHFGHLRSMEVIRMWARKNLTNLYSDDLKDAQIMDLVVENLAQFPSAQRIISTAGYAMQSPHVITKLIQYIGFVLMDQEFRIRRIEAHQEAIDSQRRIPIIIPTSCITKTGRLNLEELKKLDINVLRSMVSSCNLRASRSPWRSYKEGVGNPSKLEMIRTIYDLFYGNIDSIHVSSRQLGKAK